MSTVQDDIGADAKEIMNRKDWNEWTLSVNANFDPG